MAEWRTIWREAIYANALLLVDRSKGEAEFDRLLEIYNDDPMVRYERGEAYEYLKLFDLAESDYRFAAEHLIEPQWKRVAQDALDSVRWEKDPSGPPPRCSDRRQRVHRLHGLPRLPPDVMADAISAAARLDAEPHLAAMELRSCLELLLWGRLREKDWHYPDDAELYPMIGDLQTRLNLPAHVVDRMHDVRKLGNRAAHRRSDCDSDRFRSILEPFMEVAGWFCGSKWSQREPTSNGARAPKEVREGSRSTMSGST
jgi:hypothetical protein